jgi:glycerate kinase
MPRRILIVPDKFKGTLTAQAAAAAIARGWASVHPTDQLVSIPMSDGGDGFGSVLADSLHASPRTTPTVNAAGQPHSASWWWAPQPSIAIVETAQIIGLALLPPGQFHPFQLDTSGIGPVLRAAVDAGATECWVGIGGSATNDAGFGMARALGWLFLDTDGCPIERWTELTRLERIDPPAEWLPGRCRFTVAVDVDNPLLGPDGCSRVYGPQKGLRPPDFPQAEAALGRLAAVWKLQTGRDLASEPGSGAAGGLGFALPAFLNAHVDSGFEIFARASDLDTHIQQADLILTGEGSLDRQSLMGKGTGRVARRARQFGRPCIGLAGLCETLSPAEAAGSLFDSVHSIVPDLAPSSEAMAHAAHWLEELARTIAGRFQR